ncbi:anterograde dendritic transport of mitochondrion [Desmophyllum pertusum]|uniref:Anterograde dendritic transport of mitochondrion n=1 Tax=Desmophyllum pertusum TaxID=174260 RepID=A0A9W9YHL2_9CNID|nr:anterograde dendritic transport of mitochondrion [Desmophyllum pertusum]
MRISHTPEKGTSPARAEKGGSVKSSPAVTPPQNFGLMSLPSASSPGTSSVGQVLADVLQKASKAASEKEPTRAESLANLAKYFSNKERGSNTAPVKVKTPTSPPVVPLSSSTLPPAGGGLLLSKILGTSGLSAGLTIPAPITTTAKTSGLPTTTTSASTTPSILTRSTLVRNSSGSNLLSLAQGAMAEDASSKRHSLDSSQMLKNSDSDSSPGTRFSQLKFPTLRRRASSGDLQEMGSSNSLDQLGGGGLGARLYRSSRSKQRSTSLETFPVFKPGESPPSPSQFEQDGGSFFGRKTPSSSVDTLPGASGGGLTAGTRLSGFAGIRGFWSQGGSKSLESPAPAPPVHQQPQPKSEERLEKINKAFAFEDFGGLGLMSFFGGKSRGSSSGSQ